MYTASGVCDLRLAFACVLFLLRAEDDVAEEDGEESDPTGAGVILTVEGDFSFSLLLCVGLAVLLLGWLANGFAPGAKATELNIGNRDGFWAAAAAAAAAAAYVGAEVVFVAGKGNAFISKLDVVV